MAKFDNPDRSRPCPELSVSVRERLWVTISVLKVPTSPDLTGPNALPGQTPLRTVGLIESNRNCSGPVNTRRDAAQPCKNGWASKPMLGPVTLQNA